MKRRTSSSAPAQLTLDQARRPTGHGGRRPGAGRPRGKTKRAHTTRDVFAARFPQHVTMRVVDGAPSLRRERTARVVRAAIAAGGHRDDFRVVEFSIQGNHIHLLVEAGGATALARGMQGLTVRLARRLNAVLGRAGRLFAERYHARTLRSPREVRNVIRYVLLNARHHTAERGERLSRFWIDPYSSGPWFRGWRDPIRAHEPWLRQLLALPCPTAPAQTWLAGRGWRGGGLIVFDEVPGAASAVGRAGRG